MILVFCVCSLKSPALPVQIPIHLHVISLPTLTRTPILFSFPATRYHKVNPTACSSKGTVFSSVVVYLRPVLAHVVYEHIHIIQESRIPGICLPVPNCAVGVGLQYPQYPVCFAFVFFAAKHC